MSPLRSSRSASNNVENPRHSSGFTASVSDVSEMARAKPAIVGARASISRAVAQPEKTQAVLDHLNLHLAPDGFEVLLHGGTPI